MPKRGSPPDEFDLEPDPRILPMLGEINLHQWRCIAELVDNSIDGFQKATEEHKPIAHPEVHVNTPLTDQPGGKITVNDNGPGMSPETLEKAVRAGWTGNDPLHYLGMFGMGFNIATARLGIVTTVWTTRSGDKMWHGLEVNFEKLMRQHHFRTPHKTRPKDDLHTHGTEVSVVRMKSEQRQWFGKAQNRTRVVKELSRAYTSMLRPGGVPLSFRLWFNDSEVRGRPYCVWGDVGSPERGISTVRYGYINAYQRIDHDLGVRPFCARCWQWLPYDEKVCSNCESADEVAMRQRRVHGWLGVQRYLDENDYGIDFVRHGRKIEIGNKDLFEWTDGGVREPEYPIDDPRNRGRFVGEIHVDHCRVSYTKDRFDRSDPAWEEVVKLVRGEGPLRPDRAAELGYSLNMSPLSQLFQAYRRSSPKPKVAGNYAKLLVAAPEFQTRMREMAEHFYAGEPEYQADVKWYELVEASDRALLTEDQGDATRSERGLGGPLDQGGVATAPGPEGQSEVAMPAQVQIPSLTQEYVEEVTGRRWQVQAWEVEPTHPEIQPDRPWCLKALPSGVFEFYVNRRHPVFQSVTLTPLDALLAELADLAMDYQRANPDAQPFSAILAGLRDRYGERYKLDPGILSGDATQVLNAVSKSVSRNADHDMSQRLFDELSGPDKEAIRQKMARRTVPTPQELIRGGHFLEYAPRKTLIEFVGSHPELFFDGKYWEVEYQTIDYGVGEATGEARAQRVRHYTSLLQDAAWLEEEDPAELASSGRARLLRAAMALELLEANVKPEEPQ